MKNRKQRSDKGTVKGLRRKPGVNDEVAEDDDDETVAGPSKSRKLAMKSKATAKGNTTAKCKAAAKGKENRQTKKTQKTQLPLSSEFIQDTEEENEDML